LIILIDMDGVVPDFEAAFLAEWQKRNPDEIFHPIETRSTFYVHEQYGSELHQKVREVTSAPGFFRNMPLIANGDRVIGDLMMAGHTVRFCTSPLSSAPTCMQEKYDWVTEYFGKDMANAMIISKDKSLIRGDILIDDRPVFHGCAYEPIWEHIIFDAAYNRAIVEKRRLSNWLGAYQLFCLVEESTKSK
jgi:5'-nucleotidase